MSSGRLRSKIDIRERASGKTGALFIMSDNGKEVLNASLKIRKDSLRR